MEIEIDGKRIWVEDFFLYFDNTELYIRKNEQGGIDINKHGPEDHVIIKPNVANSINIS